MKTTVKKDKRDRIWVTTDDPQIISRLIGNPKVNTRQITSQKGTYRAIFGKNYRGPLF